VEINLITPAPVAGRDHKRLAADHKSKMADESSIEHRIDLFARVMTAIGQTPDGCAGCLQRIAILISQYVGPFRLLAMINERILT
jgi:hypothetical protein